MHLWWVNCKLPRNASSAVLSFFAPCCWNPEQEKKKKNNFGRKIEPMTASHLGGICEEQMHFSVDRVTSTIKYIIYLYIYTVCLMCTIISLYPAMHKQGNRLCMSDVQSEQIHIELHHLTCFIITMLLNARVPSLNAWMDSISHNLLPAVLRIQMFLCLAWEEGPLHSGDSWMMYRYPYGKSLYKPYIVGTYG